VRAAVGDAVLDEGPETVCVAVGLVMRYVLWDLEVETALQVDGIVALHVPKFVAVDFADVVVVLLAIDVVLEINELLATEEVVGAAELLDMAAGWMYDWPEAPDGFLDPLGEDVASLQ